MTGKQMDELVLHKPVGWTTNSTAREAFAKAYVSGYVPKTSIETKGALQPEPCVRQGCVDECTGDCFTLKYSTDCLAYKEIMLVSAGRISTNITLNVAVRVKVVNTKPKF